MSTIQAPLASVTFDLNEADFRRYHLRAFIGRRSLIQVVVPVMAVLASAIYLIGFRENPVATGYAAFIVGYAVAVVINANIASDRLLRIARRHAIGCGSRSLDLYSDRLISKTPDATSEMAWRAVRAVDAFHHALYLQTTLGTTIVVPRRAFASGSEYDEFVALARRRQSVPPLSPDLTVPESSGRVVVSFVPTPDELTTSVLMLMRTDGAPKRQFADAAILAAIPSALVLALDWHVMSAAHNYTLLYGCILYALALLTVAVHRSHQSTIRKAIEHQAEVLRQAQITIRFGEEGLWTQGGAGYSLNRWSRVREVLADSTGIYMFYSGFSSAFVPSSALGTQAEQDRLLQIIETLRDGGHLSQELLEPIDVSGPTVLPPAPSQILAG